MTNQASPNAAAAALCKCHRCQSSSSQQQPVKKKNLARLHDMIASGIFGATEEEVALCQLGAISAPSSSPGDQSANQPIDQSSAVWSNQFVESAYLMQHSCSRSRCVRVTIAETFRPVVIEAVQKQEQSSNGSDDNQSKRTIDVLEDAAKLIVGVTPAKFLALWAGNGTRGSHSVYKNLIIRRLDGIDEMQQIRDVFQKQVGWCIKRGQASKMTGKVHDVKLCDQCLKLAERREQQMNRRAETARPKSSPNPSFNANPRQVSKAREHKKARVPKSTAIEIDDVTSEDDTSVPKNRRIPSRNSKSKNGSDSMSDDSDESTETDNSTSSDVDSTSTIMTGKNRSV